jgi:hypothetical protein
MQARMSVHSLLFAEANTAIALHNFCTLLLHPYFRDINDLQGARHEPLLFSRAGITQV